MFINSTNYLEKVNTIAAENGELLLAVSFWGDGAEKIISSRPTGNTIKIICNLKSGATNPKTIDNLRKIKGINLRQHDRLHAKVAIGTSSAIVGSANFSCNGLNLEGDEIEGWEEAGILTQDTTQIKSIREWFKIIWDVSRDISDKDIEDAMAVWNKRRDNRIHNAPIVNKSTSGSLPHFPLDKFTYTDLLDRRIFLVIYRNGISKKAKAAYREWKEVITGKPVAQSAELPPIYEGWSDLPRNAQLIDIYYGPRGATQCFGAFTWTNNIKFLYEDKSEGHIDICRKENNVMGYPFLSNKDAATLIVTLRPHIEAIWNSESAEGDEGGKYILLADVVKILNRLRRQPPQELPGDSDSPSKAQSPLGDPPWKSLRARVLSAN